MNTMLKAGLATATIAVACFATNATAADLGGSLKDSYAPAYSQHSPSIAGPCYVRSDIGYSWSRDPDAEYVGNAVSPTVRGASLDNGYVIEGGLGCGMGSRGLRGEIMLGAREQRKFKGDVDIVIGGLPVDPPIHTTVKSYTMMFNAYHDFGKIGGVVPYVGAGVGWAYHKMGDITIDDPGSPNKQFGEDKLSFAWSLMAGLGYQLTDRAILDVGYRYIDMGMSRSSHGDTALAWNPRLEIDDMRAHEVKIGLRYHFGQSDCCAQQYAPMK